MDDTASNTSPSPDRRPLGFWLRIVDRQVTSELDTALEADGVSRRDWMLLNALSGDLPLSGLPEHLTRGGKRLRGLEARGWAQEQGDGSWQLTETGREAHARLRDTVDSIRSRVVAATGEDGYAALTDSLEAIARELGWDETQPRPRGRGHGRGPRAGHGFGPRHGHGHHRHGHHGHGCGHRDASERTESAYERGFTAGFAAAAQRPGDTAA